MKTDNELIAEFMGAKVYTDWGLYLDNTYYKFKHGKPTNDSPLTFEEIEHNRVIEQTAIWNPKYDTSWDWLMPVVEKCYNTQTGKWNDMTRLQFNPIYVAISTFKISNVHAQVVQYIKWYNSQKDKSTLKQ